MRVLIVASYNKGRFSPFILEQARALEAQGCEIRFFGLQGKGIGGYIRNLPLLKKEIPNNSKNISHANGRFWNPDKSNISPKKFIKCRMGLLKH